MVPLKYLSNFWKNSEMLLINCEVNLIPAWSANCFIPFNCSIDGQVSTSSINVAKLNVTLVTLSTQDKAKLFRKLKSNLKRTIN